MKRIGPKISDKAAESLITSYKSLNFGATRAIESWSDLRKPIIAKVKKIFTVNELRFLLDRAADLPFILPHATNREILISSIKASCEYDKLHTKWKVEQQKLIDKISKLSVAEIFFLQEWTENFWNLEVEIEEYLQ